MFLSQPLQEANPVELILSSGFLAFARHCGVIDAIEHNSIQIDGVCGTSSGAMVAALWLSGLTPDDIQEELLRLPPYRMLSISWRPWRGLFNLRKFHTRLTQLLPASFSELSKPFGVGVCHRKKGHLLLTSGDLPSAVVASCAMPYVFCPVSVSGNAYYDGGAQDRIGAEKWRQKRAGPAIVHIVNRTAGATDEAGLEGASVIRTPRSGAGFFSLGDFRQQRKVACDLALKSIQNSL